MEGLTLAEWTSLIEHGESRFESLPGQVFTFNTLLCLEQDCLRYMWETKQKKLNIYFLSLEIDMKLADQFVCFIINIYQVEVELSKICTLYFMCDI